MSKATTQDRLATKTPEAAFLHVMREEFRFSPRVSREILNTAQEMLVTGKASLAVRPGQVRQVVASLQAPFGPSLAEAEKVEVTLTVDAEAEDAAVKAGEGSEGLRRGRVLRLVEEALAVNQRAGQIRESVQKSASCSPQSVHPCQNPCRAKRT